MSNHPGGLQFHLRRIISYAANLAAALIATFLTGYLVVLLDRILSRGGPTSIAIDVIFGFHLLSGLTISLCILSRNISTSRVWMITAIVSGASELIFFVLNITGLVWEIGP